MTTTARHLGDELQFKEGGAIRTRAAEVLDQAVAFLDEVEGMGLLACIERGMFANIARRREGGKGYDGVVTKAEDYANPFADQMRAELPLSLEEVAHAVHA